MPMERAVNIEFEDSTLAEASDQEFLRIFVQSGSERAFGALVERHLGLVYATAVRRLSGDTIAAQDVSQLVFLELARNAGQLIRHPALPGWLYRTTCRISGHFVRSETRRRRRECMSASASALSDPDSSAFPNSESQSEDRLLDAALDRLSEADRQLVFLRFYSGLPHAGVGRALGISENAARMRVERALKRLRRFLERRGVHSSASAVTSGLISLGAASAPSGWAPQLIQVAVSQARVAPGAAGWFAVTTMKITPLTAGLLATGALTAWLLWQHHEIAGLRRERAHLLERLSNDDARPVVKFTPPDGDAAREQRAEILRLRGELARLRSLGVAQTIPHAAPPRPAPARSIPLDLGDRGNSTPEAAVTTLLWALTQQDEERFIELVFDPGTGAPGESRQFQHLFYANQLRHAAERTFTSILNRRELSTGRVRLDVGYIDPATAIEQSILLDVREGPDGWRLDPGDPPPEMIEAAGATPEAPP